MNFALLIHLLATPPIEMIKIIYLTNLKLLIELRQRSCVKNTLKNQNNLQIF